MHRTLSSILQPLLSPLRLQITPVLAKIEAGLVLSVSEQRYIRQARSPVRLRP